MIDDFDGIYCVLLICLGVLVAFVTYVSVKTLINKPAATKPNYAENPIFAFGGVLILIAMILCAGLVALFPNVDGDYLAPLGLITVSLGFALLGMIDDVFGDKSSQGFKGHISSLLKGQITTGAIKLFGGPILVLIIFSPSIPTRGYLPVFIDVITISLITNLFNLLDLAPGRCLKYSLIGQIAVICLMSTPGFKYAIFGVLCLALILDLREKFMLGDVGANLLGSIVGYSLIIAISDKATIFVLVAVVLLNILSEIVSFSKIIDSFIPLRWFDQLGQTKQRIAWAKVRRNDQINP